MAWSQEKAGNQAVFRLHLSSEPTSLDPQKQRSSSASYLLGNLYRNLLKYDDQKGLLPDLAEFCKKKSPRVIECRLKKNLQWSDGEKITSEDFLKTYREILDPKNKIPRADLLFEIKNAQDIYAGQKKTLGVSAPTPLTLKFELNRTDSEFIYNLSSLPLSPAKAGAFSGPYLLQTWEHGKKIRLVKNDLYPGGKADRPPVEFLFVDEDSVALQLYEKNELQLLRRLPTLFIPSYKNRKDFHWISVTRFDYIGFGPSLQDKVSVKKALAHGLNYPELQKIFSSYGVPGCAGLPAAWFEKDEIPCFKYDSPLAEKSWKEVSPQDQKKNYTLLFSALGGEDHRRATEWMQSQWAKLGIKVSPSARENKVFLSEMRSHPPDLFRKGIAVDRPSCLAALENFTPDNPENYLQLKSADFVEILNRLRKSKNTTQQKKYCTQGVRFLLDHYLLIPLGGFDFAMLIKTDFSGWRFNQMNQLDLADLSVSP